MRILVCVNRDLPSNLALNLLLPSLAPHDVLVGLSERVGRAAPDEPAERRELRTAEQSIPNDYWFPLVERAGLADDGRRHLTFAEIARHRAMRMLALPQPNAGDGLAVVREFGPDLVLTLRYGVILKNPVISVPRLGVLNLHSGVLPDYRGVLATFRALLAGEREIGCTLHYIEDGSIDTGAIVDTRRVPVDRNRSLLWHVMALYGPGTEMVAAALETLARGERPASRVQSRDEGRYYTYPTAAEWQAFREQGWRVADPSDLGAALARYVGAERSTDA
ncbi:MAG: formyl transferase [Proteobacteria bacterium]|nr:formyl transferase [Pseudomonadota bacterium]